MSRRAADDAIYRNRVLVNGGPPSAGQQVEPSDNVTLDGSAITPPVNTTTIMLNKPTGYVCSREGQGNRTVYDLLPLELHTLKPVGRLDKESSGLILLTTDGALAQQLTHPKYQKRKVYHVELDKPLAPLHRQMISDHGISLEDGVSTFIIDRYEQADAPIQPDTAWEITLAEGRNRQIRRTFGALGYEVVKLHRTVFGNYRLTTLPEGKYQTIEPAS